MVGLTSAWWLLEAGFRVTVVERAPEVASGASYGNGGQLSYRYVSPLADAGVPLKAIEWLFQEHGPLRFKPEFDLRQWTWLVRFLGQCTASANRRTTAKLLELGELSRSGMKQLDDIISPDDFAWRDAGKLVVYRSSKVFEQAAGKATAGADLERRRMRRTRAGARASALAAGRRHL